ncbi:MAG: pilin [Candidatus Komeilibacteria bacterium]|nr:pilin [Candidatus Komeilibacteria bacterium]
MPKSKIIIFSALILVSFLIIPALVQAAILPKCATSTQTGIGGDNWCGLCDIVQMGINIFRWILGILGGASLLLFVWHGFSWITSAGNKEKIDAARKGLLHTVIGIAIILGSWMIVNMAIGLLTSNTPAGENPNISKIFTTNSWNDFCN